MLHLTQMKKTEDVEIEGLQTFEELEMSHFLLRETPNGKMDLILNGLIVDYFH